LLVTLFSHLVEVASMQEPLSSAHQAHPSAWLHWPQSVKELHLWACFSRRKDAFATDAATQNNTTTLILRGAMMKVDVGRAKARIKLWKLQTHDDQVIEHSCINRLDIQGEIFPCEGSSPKEQVVVRMKAAGARKRKSSVFFVCTSDDSTIVKPSYIHTM
jgi:hypothetical protein